MDQFNSVNSDSYKKKNILQEFFHSCLGKIVIFLGVLLVLYIFAIITVPTKKMIARHFNFFIFSTILEKWFTPTHFTPCPKILKYYYIPRLFSKNRGEISQFPLSSLLVWAASHITKTPFFEQKSKQTRSTPRRHPKYIQKFTNVPVFFSLIYTVGIFMCQKVLFFARKSSNFL